MYEELWIRHLGRIPSHLLFPRKIGKPRQVLVSSQEIFLKGVSYLWDRTNLYVSLFSEPQKDLQLFHTCFVDYDAHDEAVSHSDMEDEVSELYYWFKRKWHGVPRWIESGRGHHLYFDFPLLFFNNYRQSIKNFYVILQQRFGHDFFDRKAYNMNKISRLPFTINTHTNTIAKWDNHNEANETWSFGAFLNGLWDKELQIIQRNDEEEIDIDADLELLMNIAPAVKDGRRVLLWQMIIPRLREKRKSLKGMLNWCNDWLEQTGVNPNEYRQYVVSQYNVPTLPYKWSTFFYYNEEMKWLKELIGGNDKNA